MNVEVRSPFLKIKLSYPVERAEEALSFLYEKSGKTELEEALEVCWSLCRDFSAREREDLTIIQTILSAERDGYVKPPNFNIYEMWERINRY